MNRFWQAFTNLFRIEDLRNRLFFTLALLAVYRLGAHIPTPGINTACWKNSSSRRRAPCWAFSTCSAAATFRQHDDFCPGHHAVHHRIHHPAVDAGGFPVPGAPAKRRRTRPAKITQYTRYLTIVLSIVQSSTIATTLSVADIGGQSLVYHPGLAFLADDHSDADHRFGLHHVAGRADQRTRHRQRHVAHHLRRHRSRFAARHRRLV